MYMERIFMREPQDEKYSCVVEKLKIGVIGMSRGSGVTFTATSLAKVLSSTENRKVTLLEICDCFFNKKALLYDSIGIDKRFKTREFTRFYSEIRHGESIRGKNNSDERINWGLISPEDIKEKAALSPIEIVRLINNIQGDLIVCDISECENSEDYLLDMDYVVVVIDPMPSRMIAGYPFIREVKRLEYKGKKVVWLINKFNPGINKRELLNFLKIKEHYKLPFIAAEHFYSAEFNCKTPYEIKGVHDEVKDVMEKIVKNELGL